MDQVKKTKSTGKKIIRIALKTILFIFIFFIIIGGLILTPPVQNFIRGKAVTYLEKKLHTKVAIGKIYIGLPKKIIIENVYVEDRQKDTLLSGGSLKVDVSLYKLIAGNGIDINSVELDNITAKVKRLLPDTVFNFQFIIDAFSSKESKPEDKTGSSSTPLILHSLALNNIRIVYKDVVTGNDAEAGLEHFDTKIDVFDLDKMRFDIPRTIVRGLTAKIYQSKPLVTSEPEINDIRDAQKPITLQLDLKNIDLQKIDLDYRNDVSALYTRLNLGSLSLESRKLDLTDKVIILDKILLDSTTAVIRLGKTRGAAVVKKETRQEAKGQAEAGWRMQLASLQLNNNNLQFDDDNSPKQKTGMDYMHLKADSFTLHINNFLFSNDSVAGIVKQGKFSEQSGFSLQQLQTNFFYSDKQAYLKDLYVKTPGTELRRDLAVKYPSIDAVKKNIGDMQLEVDVQKSKIAVKDILSFVPSLRSQPAFADPSATWLLNGSIKGSIADMQMEDLEISGLKDTRISISGKLKGLPDIDKTSADLVIKKVSSSRRDIALLLPPNTVPANITIPSRLQLSGKIKGNTGFMNTDLLLLTDLGNISVKGSVSQLKDSKKAAYDLTLATQALDLGTIMQDKQNLGPVTAGFVVKGHGFDSKTMNASLKGKITSALIKQYNYQELEMNGIIAGQLASINAAIADPNIHISLSATADLSKKYPAVKLDMNVDSIKTQPLHLTKDVIVYRGKITGDFPSTDPDEPVGKLFVLQSLLVRNEQRVPLDSIELLAGTNDSSRYIKLNSDIVNLQLQGQYKLTELGSVFRRAIQPYYNVMGTDSVKNPAPYNFTLDASVINKPVLSVFVPDLQRMDSVNLHTHFSDTDGWNAVLKAPAIYIGADHINNLLIEAGTNDSAININAGIQQASIGSSILLHQANITAVLAHNNIDFALHIKDKAEKDKYNLKGLFKQASAGNYEFSLKPEELLLNYDKWNVSADNKILIAKKDINAHNFVLNQDNQKLSINSASAAPGAPMEITFSDFKIATLTGFVQPDSTLADGDLNGKITVSDLTRQPLFTGDLSIEDLSIKKDTVGNVKLRVDNKIKDTYSAAVTITGRGNDVELTGDYFTSNSRFDLNLDIRTLPLTTAQAFSAGAIRDASGSVNGKFAIAGTVDKPSVNGALNFNKAGFNLSMLNNPFVIDQEKMVIDNEGIRFNKFEIRDSANNELVLDGTAATTNFRNYNLNFKVRADNFRALNSTKKDNKLFYGQLYFNTNLTVKGTESAPVVDGRLKVNDKTKMTIVLPQKEPGVVDREGIVAFVDKDAPLNDSLFLAVYDSLNTSGYQGMDIALNIEVDKEADFTLIVDEGNGDFLNVRGDAQLTAGIDPSGKVTLAGNYQMEQGSYDLTFNLLRRKFDIVKGSKITWEGEPTEATVNITAKYTANTAPLDLVKNQLDPGIAATTRNTYLQKLPFDVMLKMEGKLLQPKISFDIILPENKNYAVGNDVLTTVRTKLDILRQEDAEMNKQVFALLLLNRFVTEDPFSSSTSTSAATMVRQSVSKLMTEQLNRLAADLVKGVDLNFDVSSSEDYTTGERQDRTDLNVGLSKKLLNDRLTVTVGSNFELEGPQNSNQQSTNIAGNVAIDYRLSKDGRYMLRGYRKNEYQGVIDGYIVETGVGFIITVDYNRFRDIFRKQKTQEQRSNERQEKKNKKNKTGK